MNNDTNIVVELQQIAPALAVVERAMPNAVPANYFDALSDDILGAIAAETLPKVQLPYTVSDDYFKKISTNFLAKINNASLAESATDKELQAIAPILTTINKMPVYSVPQNYFESLNASAVVAKPLAKIVSITSFKKWMVYAVAACVISVVAVGAFVFNINKNKVDYSAYKKVDVTNSIDNISNEDLINYLENVNTITNANSLTTLDVKLPDIQDHLQTIPEEELKQYLKEVDVPLANDSKQGI